MIKEELFITCFICKKCYEKRIKKFGKIDFSKEEILRILPKE